MGVNFTWMIDENMHPSSGRIPSDRTPALRSRAPSSRAGGSLRVIRKIANATWYTLSRGHHLGNSRATASWEIDFTWGIDVTWGLDFERNLIT